MNAFNSSNEDETEMPNVSAIGSNEQPSDPVAFLLTQYMNAPSEIQSTILDKLSRARDPRAYPLFLAALQDTDPFNRQSAAWGLGNLHDPRATETLLPFLGDADLDVRESVAKALNVINDPTAVPALLARLTTNFSLDAVTFPRDIKEIMRALARYKAVAAVPVFVAYVRQHPLAPVRSWAVVCLKGMGLSLGIDFLPVLITALSDPASEVRFNVAEALGELKDNRAVEPLISALTDSHPAVQMKSIEALSKLGSQRAVRPLMALLTTTADTENQLAIINALVMLNAVEAIPGLDWLVENAPTEDKSPLYGTVGFHARIARAILLAKNEKQ